MFVLRSSDGDVALAGAGAAHALIAACGGCCLPASSVGDLALAGAEAAHALIACCLSSFSVGLVEAECLLSPGFFSGAIVTLAVMAVAYVPGVSSDCLGNEGGGVAGGSANGCDETITLPVVS